MSRIAWLMLFFVFVASVGFWGIDQYKIESLERSEKSSLEGSYEVEEEFVPVEVSEEVQDYVYGFFAGENEIRTYEEVDVDAVRDLLDENYEVLVLLDGGGLDLARYNFQDLKLVKVSDYDGEFFYTSKYGMEVSNGVMISVRDFEKAMIKSGGLVVAFSLD